MMMTWFAAAVLVVFIEGSAGYSKTPDSELGEIISSLTPTFLNEDNFVGYPVSRTVEAVLSVYVDRLQCVQQGLTNLECVQCLTPRSILHLMDTNATKPTSLVDLEHLSVVLLHHVLNIRNICGGTGRNDKRNLCNSYATCRSVVIRSVQESSSSEDNNVLEYLEDMLRQVKAIYEPTTRQQCFSAETLLEDLNATDGHNLEQPAIEHVAILLLRHMLKGECIDVGEAVTDFMEDLFLQYGDKCSFVITQNGFEQLLNDLKSQEHEKRTRDSEAHKDCESAGGYKRTNASHLSRIRSDFKALHHGSNHNHETFNYSEIKKKEAADEVPMNSDRIKNRSKKSTDAIEAHIHRSLADECLTAKNLLKRFSLSPSHITRTEFLQLCPALVQQAVSGVCNDHDHITKASSQTSTAELYGYSTLSVFLISLCSFCGVFLMPLMAKTAYHYVMLTFIGLSFGTMVGDALLHLIPQALGLHSHEKNGHEEEDIGVTYDTIPSYIWRQLAVIGAIYGLFMFEGITSLFTESSHDEDSHGHSHVPDKLPSSMKMNPLRSKTESTSHLANGNSQLSTELDIEASHSSHEPVLKSAAICCGLSSLALVITLGDAIHNFGDGMAIGAAFSSGLQGGLSTSLAVFCHELPHELGDFVVLLSTGLSFWKAILVNFFSALTCFVGLYIGIQLGENIEARQWILTVTAGIFLFVALVEMLPELKHNKAGDWKIFIVKNIGILLGVGIMIVIAIYEDHFHI